MLSEKPSFLYRLTSAILTCIAITVTSTARAQEAISTDFELSEVAPSVVSLTVERVAGRTQSYVGVVVSPSLILTSSDAVSGLSPKLSIGGDSATIIQQVDDKKMALISYPRGGLKPVTLALAFGEEGREINFVYKNAEGAQVQRASIVNLVSQNTSRGGYFDASLAPALINAEQAIVFNNCGELIGFFDKSIRSDVVTAKGLDEVTTVVASTGRYTTAESVCQSESEKQKIRDDIAQKQVEERETQADEALKNAEKEAKDREEEAAKALREAEEKAKADLANAKEAAEQKAAKESARIEAERQQSEEDAAQREADNQAELEKIRNENAAKKAEVQAQVDRQRKQYMFGFGALAVLLIFFLFVFGRKNKKLGQAALARDDSGTYNEAGIDLIIRGAGLSLKIPEETMSRERGATIGRSAADCDFVLDAPSISRSHLRLILRKDLLYVEDLGSANGTHLNGKQLDPGQMAALHDNDDLELADSHFSIEVRPR